MIIIGLLFGIGLGLFLDYREKRERDKKYLNWRKNRGEL